MGGAGRPGHGGETVKRMIGLLAICQALMMTSQLLVVTTSALVGLALAPYHSLATLPYALQFIAVMTVTYFASILMGRIGRKRGFLLASVVGCSGAIVATSGIVAGSFTLFCLGSFLFGVFFAFGQYYRFAAAEIATDDYRSRAISFVIAGGVVAGLAGPWIATSTRLVVAGAEFAGSYASMLGLYLVSALVLAFIRFPDGASGAGAGDAPRPLATVARQPAYVVALLAAVVAYGSMNLVMAATPLAMKAREYTTEQIAFVIGCHALGMFAPAFVTGHLIRWFGVLNVMLWGAVLLAGCVAINLYDQETAHFLVALTLLGVGWNFLFTGGTTLLTTTYRPSEKARAQGLNDFVVYTVISLTAVGSGGFHAWLGWEAINVGVAPFLALAAVLVIWLRLRGRAAPVPS